MSIKLKIDPEFKALIPPLLDDELNQLEENILSQGRCRDAITIWKGVILDGHNRYSICQKHNIPFNTINIHLANRKDAYIWILENQLGRRNISKAMKIELAIQKAQLIKESKSIDVRKTAAKDSKSSERTVQRYMTIRKLADPELLAKVQSGEEKIGTAFGKLDVTTKIVEPLCDEAGAGEIDYEPFIIRGMMDNINRIEALYRFLLDAPVTERDGFAAIGKGFKRQMKVLQCHI
ncbi:MAG: hypothetical protein FWE11_08150 [Defluviitaleaceae bacterium]|nr:hypothetical protein [Defluviitaleaceae bacterium]